MAEGFDWRWRYRNLLDWLERTGRRQWRNQIEFRLAETFETRPHGDLPRWLAALHSLPPMAEVTATLDCPRVSLATSRPTDQTARNQLEEALRSLMPWRKGPFDFFGVQVETEWRSDWKWQRITPHLSPLKDRVVLDVGCGSGYHCWRMLGAGARRVIGIDPGALFLMQFLAVRDYLAPTPPADLLPMRMEELPSGLELFDTVFSLGVLYHRRSPLEHLMELKSALKPGGELVLETLVIAGGPTETLMPRDRYARMRNVWFIPSVPMLQRWLERTGFRHVQVADVTPTTTDEQRSTDWMRFQSLPDFLDPDHPQLTAEGYPAPIRATLVAQKPA